jgi:hypothetical protein
VNVGHAGGAPWARAAHSAGQACIVAAYVAGGSRAILEEARDDSIVRDSMVGLAIVVGDESHDILSAVDDALGQQACWVDQLVLPGNGVSWSPRCVEPPQRRGGPV